MRKFIVIASLISACWVCYAYTPSGTGAIIGIATVSQPAPGIPAIASVYQTSMSFTWTSVSSEQGYTAEASTGDFDGSTIISSVTTSGSATGLTVVSLSASTSYYMRVGSRWTDGTTTYANTSPASTTTLAAGGGVSDSFTTPGALNGNWTTPIGTSQSVYIVRAGEAGSDGYGYEACASYTGTSFSDDQWAQVTLTKSNESCRSGPCVRMSSTSGNGYCVVASSASADTTLAVITAGSFASSLESCGYLTFAINDVIKLSVTGTSFTIYKNGDSVGTCTDSTYSTGKPGVYINNTAAETAGLATVGSFNAGSN